MKNTEVTLHIVRNEDGTYRLARKLGQQMTEFGPRYSTLDKAAEGLARERAAVA